jgi:Homeodomain-like domain
MPVAYFPCGNNLLRAKLQTVPQRSNSGFALPSWRQEPSLDTNESIREQVAQLIALGVNQATLAKRMGVHPSWFNRWINRKDPPRVISVTALDGFAAYLAELAAAIQHAGATTNKAQGKDSRRTRTK